MSDNVAMPPRQIIAFALAFVLGGARAQSDLGWSMLMLWIAVGVALGYRLALPSAVSTGAIFGAGLGFSSVVYGDRGHLLFIERLPAVFVGMVVGALCGVIATSAGSIASGVIVGPAKKPDWEQ